LVEFTNGTLVLGSGNISTVPAASKKDFSLQSGQKGLENNYRAL